VIHLYEYLLLSEIEKSPNNNNKDCTGEGSDSGLNHLVSSQMSHTPHPRQVDTVGAHLHLHFYKGLGSMVPLILPDLGPTQLAFHL